MIGPDVVEAPRVNQDPLAQQRFGGRLLGHAAQLEREIETPLRLDEAESGRAGQERACGAIARPDLTSVGLPEIPAPVQ